MAGDLIQIIAKNTCIYGTLSTFQTKMDRERQRRRLKRKKSFIDALKQKYCVDQNAENMSGFVIQIAFHGKPKTNGSDAELAYLRNVVGYRTLNNDSIYIYDRNLF